VCVKETENTTHQKVHIYLEQPYLKKILVILKTMLFYSYAQLKV